VVELAGNAPSVDTSRRFSGAGAWGDDGLSRTRPGPLLDGDLVRRLDVGQVCYVYRCGVTFLQIKRLTGSQAAIGRGLGAVMRAKPGAEPSTVPLPVVGPVTGGSGAGGPVSGGSLAGGSGAGGTAWPVPGPALADVSEVLDEAFGQEAR
jgi:hypothetical protein